MISVGIKTGNQNSNIKKNISVQNVLDTDSDYRRAIMGEEFVLSSAYSNVDTVRKQSSCKLDEEGYNSGHGSNSFINITQKRHSEHSLVESPTMSPLKARLHNYAGKQRKASTKG